MKLIFYILFLFAGVESYAQASPPFEAKPLTEAQPFPKPGTYQIVLKAGMDKIDIPSETLLLAEKIRTKDTITYIQYTTEVKIKVYPLSTISAPDFTPFEEYIYEK
jgi:hypothetical protein